MPAAEQNINPSRYQVIPRVLVFVTRGDELLLLKLLPRHGKVTRWTGRYNGVGGHVERGEDVLGAARRELLEETGVTASLRLCGTLVVDTGDTPGIGLYIFSGKYLGGELLSTAEGIPEWVRVDALEQIPLVEDGPILIDRVLSASPGAAPFCARSFYDARGQLRVVFSD